MVSRLKPFIDTFSTPYQNAFIQGRNITDNILLAHEIFNMLGKKKHHKIGNGALKIDMSKLMIESTGTFLRLFSLKARKCVENTRACLDPQF